MFKFSGFFVIDHVSITNYLCVSTFYLLMLANTRHGKNMDMNNKSAMPLGIWILPLNVNHSVIRRRKT